MMRRAAVLAVLALAAPAGAEPKSGIHYQAPETRALQADDFANPGMLWVERGEGMWRAADLPGGRSCASCHGNAADSMRAVAARYPAFDGQAGRVVDLEGRINLCRTVRAGGLELERESDALLALTAFVAHQSRGLAVSVRVDGPAQASFEAGRMLFETRFGQLNLACRHCHVDNAGRMLRGDRISEAMPNGYPLYRLDWQKLASLQRRLRTCFAGVRAEPFAYGAQELVDLSLYLTARANGLAIETPGVRR